MQKFTHAKLLSTIVLALSLSTAGYAEISSNEYSINSISPAQRYNRETGTSGLVGYQATTYKSKGISLKMNTAIVNSTLDASGHYILPFSGFAGIGVGINNSSTTSKYSIQDQRKTEKFDSRTITARPYFGLNLSPHVTVVYEAAIERFETENDEADSIYHKFASSYHNDNFEVGAIYNHHLQSKLVTAPQVLTLHGQAQVYEQFTLGAQLFFNRYDMLEGFDKSDNNQSLKLTSAYAMNDQWQLEAALASIAMNDSDFTGYETQLGANFTLNDKLELGSTISYTSSSIDILSSADILSLQQEASDASLEGEQFAIAFHANYVF